MRLLLLILFLSAPVAAQTSVSKVWVADNRDGTYRNPILHADYSDLMGIDGEPITTHRKPNVGRTYPIATPADSDEFNDPRFNLQWQWSANPQSNWAFPAAAYGFLRLLNVPSPNDGKNLWDVPNLLLQKFPAPSFTATAKVTFTARNNGERTGLIVMGLDYAHLSVEKKQDGLYLSQTVCQNADKGSAERQSAGVKLDGNTFWLRVRVQENAVCSFSYSVNGKTYVPVGQQFHARQGKWIGESRHLRSRQGGCVRNGLR